MRSFVVVCFFLGLVAGLEGFVSPAVSYHRDVGIPLAERIRKVESAREEALFDSRIVGGAIAKENSHPYLGGLLISLVESSARSVCGSSLISASSLVTAAHCWYDGDQHGWLMEVVLGSTALYSGGARVLTTDVVMHPEWNHLNFENDIAVITLPLMVPLTEFVQPIALPTGSQLRESFAGWSAMAAGFGQTDDYMEIVSTTPLSDVILEVMTLSACKRLYGSEVIKDTTLCTSGDGGVGICRGDSGGPLLVDIDGDKVLIGISSFVSARGCQVGHPSGFARVTSYVDFISQHML